MLKKIIKFLSPHKNKVCDGINTRCYPSTFPFMRDFWQTIMGYLEIKEQIYLCSSAKWFYFNLYVLDLSYNSSFINWRTYINLGKLNNEIIKQKKFQKVYSITITNNNISDISPLKNIRKLDAIDTYKEIIFHPNIYNELKILKISQNSVINTTKFRKLEKLEFYVDNNRCKKDDLEDKVFEQFLTHIIYPLFLDCIPFTESIKVLKIMNYNPIIFRKFPNLEELECYYFGKYNGFDELKRDTNSSITKIRKLHIRNVEALYSVQNLDNVEDLLISGNFDIKDSSNLKNIKYLSLISNKLARSKFSFDENIYPKLKKLKQKGLRTELGYKKLKLSQCHNLKYLYLEDIDFNINLSTSFPLPKKIKKFYYIDSEEFNFETTDITKFFNFISSLTELKSLFLYIYNPNVLLSIGKFSNIEELAIGVRSKLTIKLQNLHKLKKLFITDTLNAEFNVQLFDGIDEHLEILGIANLRFLNDISPFKKLKEVILCDLNEETLKKNNVLLNKVIPKNVKITWENKNNNVY